MPPAEPDEIEVRSPSARGDAVRLPTVFLFLTLAAFIRPRAAMITVTIAGTSWMEIARIVAAEIRSLRERDFAVAAEMIGASDRWIMFRELIPNAIGPIVVA